MSNYGKRMVRESKIKEIGQGGSGTSVYGHTANFVLEDGSSGDSYTVTMQLGIRSVKD